MPKDTSSDFFNEEPKKSNDTSNPDVMNKWIGVAEKGINLIETLVAMRQAKEGKTGGEASAYEKGLGQGLAQAPAPQVVEVPVEKPVVVNYKSEEAVEYLTGAFDKLDQTKTIKEYVDGEINEMKETGILKAMIEQFLKNFVEVKQ